MSDELEMEERLNVMDSERRRGHMPLGYEESGRNCIHSFYFTIKKTQSIYYTQ